MAVLWPSTALAHASFVRSEPPDVCGPLAVPRLPPDDPRCATGVVLDQPPETVRVSFSEPVRLAGRGIRVVSPLGKPVQRGKTAIEGDQIGVEVDAAEPGTYVVEWQVLSSDTHPARGRFAFSVGQPSAPPLAGAADVGQVTPLGLALQALSRWLHFAGYALAFGTLAVSLLGGSAGSRRQWTLTNSGIILLLVAEPLALLAQTASLGLDQMFDGDALSDALASPFGRLLAFRVAAALLLWVVGGSLQAAHEPHVAVVRPDLRLAAGTAIGLGIVLALIDGVGQHAGSFQPLALGLLVHGLHLMAMAVWLGGVAVALTTNGQLAGRITAFALLAIAVSGVAMAVMHIPQVSTVATTAYGQALAIKQVPVLLAAMLGLLALKRRKPGLWMGELGALVVVIGLSGLLVSLVPPR